jgi:hypothetical protein
MEVSGELYSQAAFPPGKEPFGVHRIGGWLGPEECKEAVVIPIYKKRDKTDCNTHNYQGMSLLSASIRILSTSLPSRLSPCADEIIEDNQSAA